MRNERTRNERMRSDLPRVLEVSRVVREAKGHLTAFFKHDMGAQPGQFVMVWIPGVDEKPYAVAYQNKREFGITSHVIGKWTTAFDRLKKGDKVGVRGPYGKGFSLKKNACVVGGGVGMSSVSLLVDRLSNPVVINGARSKDLVLYRKRWNMIITTDDGSLGRKGYVTDALVDVLAEGKIKIVYCCGPEIMMKKVLDICNEHGVQCELSIERMMKCGFGVCGACACDDRIICVDGPVFNSKELLNLSEFGHTARLKSGKKVSIKEYASWRCE